MAHAAQVASCDQFIDLARNPHAGPSPLKAWAEDHLLRYGDSVANTAQAIANVFHGRRVIPHIEPPGTVRCAKSGCGGSIVRNENCGVPRRQEGAALRTISSRVISSITPRYRRDPPRGRRFYLANRAGALPLDMIRLPRLITYVCIGSVSIESVCHAHGFAWAWISDAIMPTRSGLSLPTK